MPNRTSDMQQQKSTARPGRGQSSGSQIAARNGTQAAPDELFGVVSVLYHALQGAQAYGTYREDARRAGDEELVQFFENCRAEEVDRAERAKILLSDRLDDLGDEDDDDDEASLDDDEDDET